MFVILIKSFWFSVNAADAALPASSKNKSGYQETLISFQRVYLWRGTDVLNTDKPFCYLLLYLKVCNNCIGNTLL